MSGLKRFLEELKDAVVAGNVKKAKRLAGHVIDRGIPVVEAIDMLMKAMKVVDKRFEAREYFVVDVASSASAMREAFKVLEPYLEVEPVLTKEKIVIASLKGNTQGLGKDIVAATLQSAGFQVVDLGVDVAPRRLVDVAALEGAKIVAISISMEETIPYLKDVVDFLKEKNMREKVKVVIGGNAVSAKTCQQYELDAYAADAQDALDKIRSLSS